MRTLLMFRLICSSGRPRSINDDDYSEDEEEEEEEETERTWAISPLQLDVSPTRRRRKFLSLASF